MFFGLLWIESPCWHLYPGLTQCHCSAGSLSAVTEREQPGESTAPLLSGPHRRTAQGDPAWTQVLRPALCLLAHGRNPRPVLPVLWRTGWSPRQPCITPPRGQAKGDAGTKRLTQPRETCPAWLASPRSCRKERGFWRGPGDGVPEGRSSALNPRSSLPSRKKQPTLWPSEPYTFLFSFLTVAQWLDC